MPVTQALANGYLHQVCWESHYAETFVDAIKLAPGYIRNGQGYVPGLGVLPMSEVSEV
jgi:hypothetical protein